MEDEQIRKIVGSRASWMMKWGILFAFGVFLCIYSAMYCVTYRYEKNVTALACRDENQARIIRLYPKTGSNLREIEIANADSVRISFTGDGKNTYTTGIRQVLGGQLECYIECEDSVNYLLLDAPEEIDVSLIITRMSLLDIIFKDVGLSMKQN